jgi:hypothetical protein
MNRPFFAPKQSRFSAVIAGTAIALFYLPPLAGITPGVAPAKRMLVLLRDRHRIEIRDDFLKHARKGNS